jgi:hypothetical protein
VIVVEVSREDPRDAHAQPLRLGDEGLDGRARVDDDPVASAPSVTRYAFDSHPGCSTRKTVTVMAFFPKQTSWPGGRLPR